MSLVTIKALHKSYGNKKVLQNINLSFERGMVSGVVGENGAGKTTLFNCLSGMESYDGAIQLGESLNNDSIGFLPTTPFMLSKITGLEYLQLLCNAREVDSSQLIEKNIFELPLNEYADLYSTGMKKKLAITALLLQKNEIFLLDEPFNGLDLSSNIMLKAIIEKLKSLNKVVIISSHIFSALTEVCDQMHYLNAGLVEASVGQAAFSTIEAKMTNTGLKKRIDDLGLE